MKKYLLIPVFVFMVGPFTNLFGVPAYPDRIQYRQPSGNIIDLYLQGDEKIHWAITPEGYTILSCREGEYQYAMIDASGDLVLSGVPVSPSGLKSQQEQALLQGLSPGLYFSERQVEMLLSVWELKNDFLRSSFPTTGARKLLCILMETPDKPFTRSREEFDALFNQLNYTLDGATGSLRDFYLENSWGQFDITVDVVGPFTATKSMNEYSSFEGARNLITEGVHLANPFVNYADYDNNNDGIVDGVYMIFSGHGQEAGGGTNTIWSHAWSIQSVQLDGVWLSRYACSPELRGNAQSNPQKLITRMGVIGHEFGHVLGAPDYYDTDGDDSGGNFPGTGQWDMMASGTWNNGGATPAHHNAYTKTHIFKWAEPVVLDSPQSITLYKSIDTPNSFYRINTLTTGEYYLLENRHRSGFDQALPGEGMIIYHVSSRVAAAGNNVNAGHPQNMYPVFAAAPNDPQAIPLTYGDINSPFTPFPGQGNITAFTDFTSRTSRAWSGVHTNKPVSNITRNIAEGTVSFDFMNPDLISQWLEWDDGYSTGSIGVNEPGIFQIAKRFTIDDLQKAGPAQIRAVKVYINQPASSAHIKIWQKNPAGELIEYVSRHFWQSESRWNLVNLSLPYVINPDQELWFGVEFADPGPGVFPAGRDNQTNFEGKGNLVRTQINDPDAWTTLSQYNIQGDWSIKALLTPMANTPRFYDINLVASPAEGGSLSGIGSYPLEKSLTVSAQPAVDWKFLSWTDNGEVVSTTPQFTFEVSSDRSLQANFQFAASVDIIAEKDFSIWPNPATQAFIVQVPQHGSKGSLRLINAAGQEVWSYHATASMVHELEVDIRHLSAGVYLMQWNDDNGRILSRKLIIE